MWDKTLCFSRQHWTVAKYGQVYLAEELFLGVREDLSNYCAGQEWALSPLSTVNKDKILLTKVNELDIFFFIITFK